MRFRAFIPVALFFFLLFSCGPGSKTPTVSYSPVIDSLLHDTVPLHARADSLRNLLLRNPGDSAAIAALSELPEYFFGKLSRDIAEEAFALGSKPGNAAYAPMAWCARGVAAHRSQQYDTALYYLDRSILLAEKSGDGYTALRAATWKGDCYRMTYRADDAQRQLDSCAATAEQAKWPRLQAQALSLAGDIYRYKGLDSLAVLRYKKAIEVATANGDSARVAFSLASLAQVLRGQSDGEGALRALERGLVAAKSVNDLTRAAFILSIMGDEYRFKGKQPEALACYTEALVCAKRTNEKRRYGITQNVITQVYWSQGDLDKAFAANTEALNVFTEIADASSLAYCLANRGEIFRMREQLDSALVYYRESLRIAGEIGDSQRAAYAYAAIADIYHGKLIYDSALVNAERAIALGSETGDDNLLSDALRIKAITALDRGDLRQARAVGEESLEVALRSQTESNIVASYELLYLVYKSSGMHKEALQKLEEFSRARDSLKGTEQVRRLAAVEYQAKENALKAEQAQREAKNEAEKKLAEEALERQRLIATAAVVGGLLLLVLLGVAFNAYRNKRQANKIIQQQKHEVEHQKSLVEEKNREVHDSITYARRLQDAILPPARLWKQHLPDSFVLYQPKDIVAGDFYWMETVLSSENLDLRGGQHSELSSQNSDLLLFAVADCTGHGVPGALVSMVCSNALNRAVKEFGITDPGKILDKVTELVLETFERSESEVSDGMDISLCCLDRRNNRMLWAGANNPLWIARGGELIELKPDKQPVGQFDNRKPFTTHSVQLQQGDCIYVFSDGYADQFGGPEGKKFKYSQLRRLLLSISGKPMPAQEQALLDAFETWKQDLVQIDDVCVVGVQI